MSAKADRAVVLKPSGPLFETGKNATDQWLIYAVNLLKVETSVARSIFRLRTALHRAKSGIVIHRFDPSGTRQETRLDEVAKLTSPQDIGSVRSRMESILATIPGYQSGPIEVKPFRLSIKDVQYSLSADHADQMILDPGHYLFAEDGQAFCKSCC